MRTIAELKRSELNRSRHVCPDQLLIHLFQISPDDLERNVRNPRAGKGHAPDRAVGHMLAILADLRRPV